MPDCAGGRPVRERPVRTRIPRIHPSDAQAAHRLMPDADHRQSAPFPGTSGEHEAHDISTHDDDGLTTGTDPASGVDPFATLDKRRRGVRVTYAAAIALGLAIGGGAVAG